MLLRIIRVDQYEIRMQVFKINFLKIVGNNMYGLFIINFIIVEDRNLTLEENSLK